MDPILITAAALAALASPAKRSDGGAVATATVSVTIRHASASVGPGRPHPKGAKEPRKTKVNAADGSSVDALVYDFE